MRIDARTHLRSLIDYDEMNCYSAVLNKKCEAEVNDETEQILSSKEIKLTNDITVYRTLKKIENVMKVIDEYLII